MPEFVAGGSEFIVDFSEAQEFIILPIDWYTVEVAVLEVKESQGGTPMVNARLKVVEGTYEGQNVFVNWMLAGKGTGITKAALEALLGRVPEDGEALSGDELIGSRMSIRVIPKPWKIEDGGDGEMRNTVSRYKALPVGAASLF